MRKTAHVIMAIAIASSLVRAQAQMVRVTVPKANVRSEPSDKSPILQQAVPRDQIEWRATEGDWFKVLLPPNPSLGGARVEAYISRKVSKLETTANPVAVPSASPAAPPAPPMIDTHAANVFLGTILDGTPLRPLDVQLVHSGNRDAWTVQDNGDWRVAGDRRPGLVVSIGDRAGVSADSVAPSVVRMSVSTTGVLSRIIGSSKGDKDWKADEISAEMTQGTAGVWNIKPSRDLKPGDYAIILRPTNSKTIAPQTAWVFSVK